MKRIVCGAAAVLVCFVFLRTAFAICGDVTGDGQKSATDALAVLRSAVGQEVELTCAGEGPSRLRFYNDFSCNSGSSVSEARFNGFTFTADAGLVSEYQSVELEQIDTIEIDLCGETFAFAGPVDLPPDRSITFLMALLDPAIYVFPGVDTPAYFVLYDDGVAASAAATSAPGDRSSTAGLIYGGRRARAQ